MTYLVDTDWIIDFLKGKGPAVQLLESLAQEGAALSLITYGEIYEGIYYGKNRRRHEEGFTALLQVVEVLSLDQPILEEFARIRGQLRAQGRLIGDFDLLIAATAIYHNLTLVTQNTRHFNRIADLKLYQPS
jgi:tRNA(fMet)-specific endonuclease VapC